MEVKSEAGVTLYFSNMSINSMKRPTFLSDFYLLSAPGPGPFNPQLFL